MNKDCRVLFLCTFNVFIIFPLIIELLYIRMKPHRWCNSGVLASSVVDRQTKDYTIGMCCFSAKHETLRRKSNNWLARNQNNVSEWSDMSTRGMLFQ